MAFKAMRLDDTKKRNEYIQKRDPRTETRET